MATILTGTAGKILGKFLNKTINSTINNTLFSKKRRIFNKKTHINNNHTAGYGHNIPFVFGTMPVKGVLLWQSEIAEHCTKNKRFLNLQQVEDEIYTYTVSFMIGICQGPISSLGRIWLNDQLINDLSAFRLYLGHQDQPLDPLISATCGGQNNAPNYPYLAYLVAENFDITPFNNEIPNFTFEVHNYSRDNNSLENSVKSLIIIPGSGEFVYDTQIQYVKNDKITAINQHHQPGLANAVVSLEQMDKTLPEVEWVAPVVSWFVDDLNIKNCNIKPGVENIDITTFPDQWSVSGFIRQTAHQISHTVDDKLNYGGTISDASIRRYLQTIRHKGYKSMFYPLLFVDNIDKSWRGKITGEYTSIPRFFQQYREFILHYAYLSKGLVDAFLIGSELEGLTKIQSPDGVFPAIMELRNLAIEVKKILGPDVKISYAANWSEYHSYQGLYHMDDLWSCDAIDFIGIDAYFPLSNSTESLYNHKSIIDGWNSGEGYDFYFENGAKKPLEPMYAWKNIEYWLHNLHYNPDGTTTSWRPSSKKIWFTEYGFPSVHCATNEPNRFFDYTSIESSLPRYSSGKVDILAQRIAIEATEMRWNQSESVERRFVWCWDARPYPTWPNLNNIWTDGPNWQKGHWINGKAGLLTLQQVIANLWMKANLDLEKLDVTELYGIVKGFLVEQNQSLLEVITLLKRIYNFIIVEENGKIKFSSHYYNSKPLLLHESELVDRAEVSEHYEDYDGKSFSIQHEVPMHHNTLFYYFNNQLDHTTFQLMGVENKEHTSNIYLPCVLSNEDVQQIAIRETYNIKNKHIQYNFLYKIDYNNIKVVFPGCMIIFNDIKLIITSIKFISEYLVKIVASPYNALYTQKYDLTMLPMVHNSIACSESYSEHIIDILPLRLQSKDEIQLLIGAFTQNWFGVKLSYEFLGSREEKIIKHNAIFGDLLKINTSNNQNTIIDRTTIIKVKIYHGKLFSISEEELFNTNKNLAIIDNKIIQFQLAELQADNSYLIKNIIHTTFNNNNTITNNKFLLIEEEKILKLPHYHKLQITIENRLDKIGLNFSNAKKYDLLSNKYLQLQPFNLQLQDNKLKWDNMIISQELFPELATISFDITCFDKFDRMLSKYSAKENAFIIPEMLDLYKVEVALMIDNSIVSEKATIIKPTSL